MFVLLSVDCSASNLDLVAALPHRLHLDQCHFDAPAGRETQMDLLGSRPELCTAAGHNRLYDHLAVLRRAGECGEWGRDY